ncbi:MAG: molybdenum cofactor guanylyltransferase [Planctomycetota bacterium]
MTRLAPSFPLYVLAGGRSRRFGSDKARADFHGRALIQHVVDSLDEVSSSCTVVAAAKDAYADLGFETIGDLVPGHGPLAGLETALCHAEKFGHPWVLLASCDLVAAGPKAVTELANAVDPCSHSVAVFSSSRWYEPFPGLYSTASLPELRQMRGAADASMQGFFAAISERLHAVAPSNDSLPYCDANTVEQLAAYRHQQCG